MATIQNEEYTIRITKASDGTANTGVLVEFKTGAFNYPFVEVGNGYYHIASIPTGKYSVWVDSNNTNETRAVGEGQIAALGNEADAISVGTADDWELQTPTELKTTLDLENVSNIAVPDPTGQDGKVLSVVSDAYQLESFSVGDKLDKIDPTAQSVVSAVTFEDTITLNTTAPETPIKTLGRNASNEVIEFDNVVGGGQVDSVVGGSNVTIDNTDPINPIINATDTDTTISESTGVLTGGTLSTGAGASEYSISDGTGQLVDGVGVITPVSWSGKSNITPTNLATNLISWVGINSAGNVVEQVTAFTRAQARTIIILGVVVHVNLTTVDAVNNEQHIAYNAMTSTYDLAESIGFFNVEGNVFSANGANLNIDQSSGKLFKMGSNYDLAPVDNPHVRSLASLAALSFQYRFSDGSNGVTGIAIDPTTLDDGAGGTTNVPNNQFSVQRIYIFTSGNVKIQRGVESFPNLDSALAGYSSEAYVTEPSIEANGLLRGFLVLREDVTDLTDTTKAVFISAPKFGEGGGSTGASASALDLQTAYNNSIDPEILTDTTRGPLTLKRGSVADTDNVIEVQNGTGTTTFEVTGEGDLDISGDATIGGTATIGGRIESLLGHYNLNETDSILNGIVDSYGTTLTGSKYVGFKQTSTWAFLYAGASALASANELHIAVADSGGVERVALVVKDWGLQLQSRTNATPSDGDLWNNGDSVQTESPFTFTSLTTTEKNALSVIAGTQVFDSTLGKMCFYNGSAWETITSV